MNLLFLNSIGGFEVMFILLAVLMLFGSKSIPGLAKSLGKGMREIRSASNEIKRDIQNSTLEMRKDIGVGNPLDDIKKLIEEPNQPRDFRPDNPETTLEAPADSKPIQAPEKKRDEPTEEEEIS